MDSGLGMRVQLLEQRMTLAERIQRILLAERSTMAVADKATVDHVLTRSQGVEDVEANAVTDDEVVLVHAEAGMVLAKPKPSCSGARPDGGSADSHGNYSGSAGGYGASGYGPVAGGCYSTFAASGGYGAPAYGGVTADGTSSGNKRKDEPPRATSNKKARKINKKKAFENDVRLCRLCETWSYKWKGWCLNQECPLNTGTGTGSEVSPWKRAPTHCVQVPLSQMRLEGDSVSQMTSQQVPPAEWLHLLLLADGVRTAQRLCERGLVAGVG